MSKQNGSRRRDKIWGNEWNGVLHRPWRVAEVAGVAGEQRRSVSVVQAQQAGTETDTGAGRQQRDSDGIDRRVAGRSLNRAPVHLHQDARGFEPDERSLRPNTVHRQRSESGEGEEPQL